MEKEDQRRLYIGLNDVSPKAKELFFEIFKHFRKDDCIEIITNIFTNPEHSPELLKEVQEYTFNGLYTLLHFACCGHADHLLEPLIRFGARPDPPVNSPYPHRKTCFFQMIIQADKNDDQNCANTLRALKEACQQHNVPLDLDFTDCHFESSLHYAAHMGLIHTTRCLVELGATVNIPSSNGRVPLEYAIERNKNQVVQYLKTVGGKENIAEEIPFEYRTPEWIAHGFLDDEHSHKLEENFGGALWATEEADGEMLPMFCTCKVPKRGMALQIKVNLTTPIKKLTFTMFRGMISEVIEEHNKPPSFYAVTRVVVDHTDIPTFQGQFLAKVEWNPNVQYNYVLTELRRMTEDELKNLNFSMLAQEAKQLPNLAYLEIVKSGKKKNQDIVLEDEEGCDHDHGHGGHGHSHGGHDGGHGHSHGGHDGGHGHSHGGHDDHDDCDHDHGHGGHGHSHGGGHGHSHGGGHDDHDGCDHDHGHGGHGHSHGGNDGGHGHSHGGGHGHGGDNKITVGFKLAISASTQMPIYLEYLFKDGTSDKVYDPRQIFPVMMMIEQQNEKREEQGKPPIHVEIFAVDT